MSDGDAVVVDDDLLDEQSDDALAFEHVQALHLRAQTLEEFAQRVSKSKICGLIDELGTQRFEFCLQPCLALPQLGHSPAQLVQAEEILLVGRQQPLNAPLGLQQLAGGSVLVLLGRMRRARGFDAPGQLRLDQRRIFKQSSDLGPHGLLEQIEPDGRSAAARLALIAPGVRTQASVVVDLARAAARGSPIQRVAATGAVHQALQDARLNRATRGELLVVLESLLRQLESAFVHQCGHGNLDPLILGSVLQRARGASRRMATYPCCTVVAMLSRGLLGLAEAGHASVRRVTQHRPDRRALPAGLLLPRRHRELVESPRDGTDAQRLRGVEIEDLAHHLGLRLDDFVIGRALLGLAHLAIAVRRAAEYADLALLGAMAFAAARPLQDLGALVFGDHALELQQQLVLGGLRLWSLDEDRLHAVAQPFLGEEHLIGVFAAEAIGRQHKDRLDLAFSDEIEHSLQTGSNQRGPAEALVLDDPLSRYAVALAGSERHQCGRLACNRLVLLLLVGRHPRIDRRCLHDRVLLLESARRCGGCDREPGCHRPARAWRRTDGQSNTRSELGSAGGAQPRRRSRVSKAETARETTSPIVVPVPCACARSFTAMSSGTLTVMATLGAATGTGRLIA